MNIGTIHTQTAFWLNNQMENYRQVNGTTVAYSLHLQYTSVVYANKIYIRCIVLVCRVTYKYLNDTKCFVTNKQKQSPATTIDIDNSI